MNTAKNDSTHWTTCLKCQGRGKRSLRIRKKIKIAYQVALDQFNKTNGEGPLPEPPKGHLSPCANCEGSGLVESLAPVIPDTENYPHVAIIGGGIGGMALAVACSHRGIPFTLYERDLNFEARSQGYGLTLQQASKAIEGFGIPSLTEGVHSIRHLVHTPEGKVIGEWGGGQWTPSDTKTSPKRTNIHIARQSLRLALLKQLGGPSKVTWGHQLVDFKHTAQKQVDLTFQVNRVIKQTKADLVVGADGIRSAMRKLSIGEEHTPLQYLGCIVILGICPLAALDGLESPLLDSATVFQTANGTERIYMMPYDKDAVMWQLSFPMDENAAKALSALGSQALKEEACRRTPWHDPIPQVLAATLEKQISGYPVYDRALLKPETLAQIGPMTLIGDAAHPMSPFKGQGANQALLDALALARGIAKGCGPYSEWNQAGIRDSVLTAFESEMLTRSAIKVKDSAEAAEFLHSDVVLHEGNEPRGQILRNKES